MMKTIGCLTIVGSVLLLSGCGISTSPREKCEKNAYLGANAMSYQMNEIERSLSRGYRIVYSTQPTTRMGSCMTNTPGYRPISYRCQKNSTMTVETPVSIDHNEERKKLAKLKRDYPGVLARAEKEFKMCSFLQG